MNGKGETAMNVTYLSVGNMGANCYFVSDDKGNAVIIDPGADSERILKTVKENNFTVFFVLLTHAHFDHIMAAEAVCTALGAPLCVGAADASMLGNDRLNLSSMVYPNKPVSLTADRQLREGDVIAFGDAELTVWETPGHTPGCVCFFGKGVLFTGDTLFAGSIGRTDLPGGDMSALRRSLARLAALDVDYTVYSGHGEETKLSCEKAANPYLAHIV